MDSTKYQRPNVTSTLLLFKMCQTLRFMSFLFNVTTEASNASLSDSNLFSRSIWAQNVSPLWKFRGQAYLSFSKKHRNIMKHNETCRNPSVEICIKSFLRPASNKTEGLCELCLAAADASAANHAFWLQHGEFSRFSDLLSLICEAPPIPLMLSSHIRGTFSTGGSKPFSFGTFNDSF